VPIRRIEIALARHPQGRHVRDERTITGGVFQTGEPPDIPVASLLDGCVARVVVG